MNEKRCSQQVRVKGLGWPTYQTCARSGVVLEDGKWWCKQHAPSAVKARRDKARTKDDAEWAKRRKENLAVKYHDRLVSALLNLAEWVARNSVHGLQPDECDEALLCLKDIAKEAP